MLVVAEKVIGEANWEMTSDTKDTCLKIKACIVRITKDILGESGDHFMVKKDTTWGNEEIKTIIKEKKKCYLALEKCRNEEI